MLILCGTPAWGTTDHMLDWKSCLGILRRQWQIVYEHEINRRPGDVLLETSVGWCRQP
jgi:hypothetical protein